MRKLLSGLVMAMAISVAAHAQPLMAGQYATESDAHRACGGDQVVWANLDTHVLHVPGDKFYGHTKHGAFVCRTAALRSGMHVDQTH